MKLLLLTQKVDRSDDVLGFVHQWISEMANYWDSVTVICLYEGEHNLPKNVTVRSLGKESGASRWKYVSRFYTYALGNAGTYDRVFVHMNPEYIVLGGLFWKITGKKIALWYSHKSVDTKLKIAAFFADIIFTTAPQSVRIKTPKLRFMGHGIDVAAYACRNRTAPQAPNILSVGRITRIKQCEVLLRAGALLKEKYHMTSNIVFAGKPVNDDDKAYELTLKKQVANLVLTNVTFTGSIPLEELKSQYCTSEIVVNMVPTGGLDKVVLEGMAAGNLVLSSNDAFKHYFGPHADRLSFADGNAEELAQKIADLWNAPDREEVRAYLVKESEQFDVKVLMEKLSTMLQEV